MKDSIVHTIEALSLPVSQSRTQNGLMPLSSSTNTIADRYFCYKQKTKKKHLLMLHNFYVSTYHDMEVSFPNQEGSIPQQIC